MDLLVPLFLMIMLLTKVDGEVVSYKTTEDIFKQLLHSYTITNAIEDRNVLRFHIDYFKGQGNTNPKPEGAYCTTSCCRGYFRKHEAATHHRRFNAVFLPRHQLIMPLSIIICLSSCKNKRQKTKIIIR